MVSRAAAVVLLWRTGPRGARRSAFHEFLCAAGFHWRGIQRRVQHWIQPRHASHHDDEFGTHLRLTPPEWLATAKPECCEALWEDVTNFATITGLDPILWTDQNSGRTFSSNSTAGTNGSDGYSDHDGELAGVPDWNPVSGVSPNVSSDHQTIGSGPFPSGGHSSPSSETRVIPSLMATPFITAPRLIRLAPLPASAATLLARVTAPAQSFTILTVAAYHSQVRHQRVFRQTNTQYLRHTWPCM